MAISAKENSAIRKILVSHLKSLTIKQIAACDTAGRLFEKRS